MSDQSAGRLQRSLTLWNAIWLLAGGIIGSGIFLASSSIAQALPAPGWFLLVWLIGAGVSLLACLAFAELGAMFPDAGGQYIYLREAWGECPAFLWGWISFLVTGPGTIATLAVGFAAYLGVLAPRISGPAALFHLGGLAVSRAGLCALAAIALLSAVNIVGVRPAVRLQNASSLVKFAAMAAFIVLGFLMGHGSWRHLHSAHLHAFPGAAAWGVALVAVFWAYDGWVYVSWMAGELRDPERNLPRALFIGLFLVAAIYLLLNAVYLYALPISRMAHSPAVAETAARHLFSPAVAGWLTALVALSCFSAMAGGITAFARIYFAMAADGCFFPALARIHPRFRTPAASLAIQALWAMLLTLSGSFTRLFTYTMFMMVLSYVATVAGLFVLRRRQPRRPRPYRCPGYPWLPGAYIVFGSAWLLSTLWQSPRESVGGVALLALGLPAYFYFRQRKASRPEYQAAGK